MLKITTIQFVLEEGFLKTFFTENYYDINSTYMYNVTCDLYNVLRRGMKQKIIGLSLYGTNEKYYRFLKAFAIQAKSYYADWIIRVHHDSTIKESIKCELECYRDERGILFDNIDFCNINKIPYGLSNNKTWSSNYTHAMKWRWLPIGDSFVDTFISRDTDSSIHDREYQAVKNWLQSNTLFHIMRGE